MSTCFHLFSIKVVNTPHPMTIGVARQQEGRNTEGQCSGMAQVEGWKVPYNPVSKTLFICLLYCFYSHGPSLFWLGFLLFKSPLFFNNAFTLRKYRWPTLRSTSLKPTLLDNLQILPIKSSFISQAVICGLAIRVWPCKSWCLSSYAKWWRAWCFGFCIKALILSRSACRPRTAYPLRIVMSTI